MKSDKRFLLTAGWLLGIHALSLTIMSLFRLTEFASLHNMITEPSASVLKAFAIGVWFDNVVASYIMIVPLAVLLLSAAVGYTCRWLRTAAKWWFCIFYAVVFMVSAANTPYFQYFFKNINSSIFEWFGYATTTAGMVFQEKSYLLYIAIFFLFTAIYVFCIFKFTRYINKCFEKERKVNERYSTRHSAISRCTLRVAFTACLIGLCLFGIRGRRGYNPIKISQAYYCNDPFLNQLGISPAFNLLTSTLDDMRKENRDLHLMPDNEAITISRRSLGITSKATADSSHVLLRHISSQGKPIKRNVVVILMESMSANLLSTFGNKESLTPTLDSLYNHSLAFTHCYSAGIHTNHGMTASLYSFPALMFRNLMKGTVTPHRTGIPTVLKQQGYHNMFFMTHEAQYDNMKAFFTTNGYDEIFSQENYPASEVVNSFGVSDHFLFDYALNSISQRSTEKKPFFATLLTISNHPPYVIPSYFKPKTSEPETQIVEYADWSIGNFLKKAKNEPWYGNTIFVILADHGKLIGNPTTEVPESYNHIPMIIFGPDIPVMRYDSLATQVDLMPTLLALLNMSYDYEGFGQDLLANERKMTFYSADNQIIARNKEKMYVFNPKTSKEYCYDIRPDGTQREARMTKRFAPLKEYAFSMIQTAQFALKKQQ